MFQDEQDRHAEKLNFLEQTLERNRNRIEEEKKSNTELVNMMNSLKTDLDEKNRTIEELKEKLKNTSSKTIAELGWFKISFFVLLEIYPK